MVTCFQNMFSEFLRGLAKHLATLLRGLAKHLATLLRGLTKHVWWPLNAPKRYVCNGFGVHVFVNTSQTLCIERFQLFSLPSKGTAFTPKTSQTLRILSFEWFRIAETYEMTVCVTFGDLRRLQMVDLRGSTNTEMIAWVTYFWFWHHHKSRNVMCITISDVFLLPKCHPSVPNVTYITISTILKIQPRWWEPPSLPKHVAKRVVGRRKTPHNTFARPRKTPRKNVARPRATPPKTVARPRKTSRNNIAKATISGSQERPPIDYSGNV